MKIPSENKMVDIFCSGFANLEVEIERKCWLSRVLSHSKITDKDFRERGLMHELLENGFENFFNSKIFLLALLYK